MLRPNVDFNRIPTTLLSLRFALLLFIGDLILGIFGYMFIEGYGLIDSIYMTIITLSTVGYTEVHPLSSEGQLFTSFFILLNIGLFAYLLAVFSYYIIEGKIFQNMHLKLIKDEIDALSDHVILCGFGKYGKEVAEQFDQHDIPYVIIDNDPDVIEQLQHSEEKVLYLEHDATHDKALLEAGIERAISLISALPEDSDNVFTVLTANQLNPQLNIISRAKEAESEQKLLLAGADHVVMPEQIGGFYMATLVSKPGAVEFFSFITSEYRSDIGFEEIKYEDLPDSCKGQSIRDLSIRQDTGTNIIGFKHADGNYEVNPGPDTVLSPNTSFIALGNNKQLAALKEHFTNYPEKAG